MAVNDFDYFLRGEATRYGNGTSSTTAFDYFNRGEPYPAGIPSDSVTSFSYTGGGVLTTSNTATVKPTYLNTGSGVLRFSNAATVTGPNQFAATGEGLLTFSNAATVKPTYLYAASGVLVFGNSADVVPPGDSFAADGGGLLSFSNGATVKPTYRYTGSGVLGVGESSVAYPTFRYAGAGVLRTTTETVFFQVHRFIVAVPRRMRIVRSTTTATRIIAAAYTGSGTLRLGGFIDDPRWVTGGGLAALSGTAATSLIYRYTGGGKLSLGSTAGVTPPVVSYTGSGVLRLGGVTEDPRARTGVGGMSLGGTAGVVVNGNTVTSGGMSLGGSAAADYVVYIIGPDPGLVSIGGSADVLTNNYFYSGSGLLRLGSADAPVQAAYSYTAGGSLTTGESAVANLIMTHDASGGLLLSGRARMVFNLEVVKTFSWAISQGVMRTYRVEGKCRPANHPCPPTHNPSPGCPTGTTMQYAVNVQAHSVADLCERLTAKGWVGPIKRIQMWSLPVNKSDWSADDKVNCNTLSDVDFDKIPECLDFTVDQEFTVGVRAGVQLIFIDNSTYSYEASGGLGVTGTSADVLSPIRVYVGGGSLTTSGESSVYSPQWQTYVAGGKVSVGGTSSYYSSHLGDLVSGARSGNSITNLGIEFGYTSAPTIVASVEQIQATCCTALTLPQVLYVKHDLNRSDRISRFLKVNGFTLPPVLKMTYSQKRNTWYTNVHWSGISVMNYRETVDIVMEFGCMSEDSVVGVSQNVWGFSVFVRSRNVNESRFESTRLLLEFDPATVCDVSGDLKFDFTFNLNTQKSVPSIVRTALFADYLGTFKSASYSANPTAVFEVAVNTPPVSAGLVNQSKPLKRILLGVE